MHVETCYPEELMGKLTGFLRSENCHRIALPVSKLLDSLDVPQHLRDAGFDAKRWDAMTLDELYDYDCGVTDVTYASPKPAASSSEVQQTMAAHSPSSLRFTLRSWSRRISWETWSTCSTASQKTAIRRPYR